MDIEVETVSVGNISMSAAANSNSSSGISNPELTEEIISFVDNPEVLDTYIQVNTNTLDLNAATTECYEYVIITTNELRDAAGEYTFADLIEAKQACGINAIIVTVEDDIYPNYSGLRPDGGSDNQTKIRNFIIDYYQNHGTRYVLLGGNKDLIPPRLFYVVVATMYQDTIPADIYYGCLDGTFDGDKDGSYGESLGWTGHAGCRSSS